MSRIIEPSLTTIHVPKQYMGEMAARRLNYNTEMKGTEPVKIEIATQVIERNSVS